MASGGIASRINYIWLHTWWLSSVCFYLPLSIPPAAHLQVEEADLPFYAHQSFHLDLSSPKRSICPGHTSGHHNPPGRAAANGSADKTRFRFSEPWGIWGFSLGSGASLQSMVFRGSPIFAWPSQNTNIAPQLVRVRGGLLPPCSVTDTAGSAESFSASQGSHAILRRAVTCGPFAR